MRVLGTVAMLVLAATASAAEAETPLFDNGDFEQGVAGWRALDMSGQASFEPDPRVKQSGKQSLRIEKRGPGANDWLKQSATLPAGTKEVHASCWFKVDRGARAEVYVYFFGAADQDVGKGQMSLVASGPNRKWEKADERYEVPSGAVAVGVNVKVTVQGVFWLDGLSIAAVGGVAGLANGGFEEELGGWRPMEHGSGTAEATADRSRRAQGKASAKVVRTNPRHLVEDGLVAEVRTAEDAGKQRLRFQVRLEGEARAAAALQAFDERGVCVATARAPVAGDGGKFVPGEVLLEAPKGVRRLVVSLIVTGAGTAWFDDVVLTREK